MNEHTQARELLAPHMFTILSPLQSGTEQVIRAWEAEELLAAILVERDSLLADWNGIVKAIGAKTNGGAIGHAHALVAKLAQANSALVELVKLKREKDALEAWRPSTDGDARVYNHLLDDYERRKPAAWAAAFAIADAAIAAQGAKK